MTLKIIREDITKLAVDTIVNAANTDLQRGGGVCGAIFNAAGPKELQAACNKLAPIRTGDAVITEGYNLPAKHIVHTAGPIYRDGNHGEEELLRACYANSLAVAAKKNCKSIAFPLISSGIYGYPKADALRVAVEAIRGYLAGNDMEVYLVLFDQETFTILHSRQLITI